MKQYQEAFPGIETWLDANKLLELSLSMCHRSVFSLFHLTIFQNIARAQFAS